MMNEILKDKPTGRGGARPGSGRPKGGMNQATKDRLAVKQAYQERVAAQADRLFNSQFNLATGEQYLMWRHKVGTGAKERTVVEVVTDPETIKQFINEELDQQDDFYFISTKPANGMAIDSMLDRSFGKAEQNMKLGNDPENPLPGTVAIDPLLAADFAVYLKQRTKED